MPFYETVFETGRSSVANYENDDEARIAIGEHHRRAMVGEVGGPVGAPAERIAAVYVYAEHPDNYNAEQTMSADVLMSELEALVKKSKDSNGVVNVDQLVGKVRGLTHPMMAELKKPFDSRYRVKEDKTLDLKFLEGVTG